MFFCLVSLALLVSPLIAMQFTHQVDWDRADFLSAALLLAAIGVAIELAIRVIRRPALRGIAIIAVITCAALVWADAAVGVF
ncbi:MAG: hypothetical protein EOP66_12850 [Sphingomonas sp.]|nr:MAG: hypothetical protein EOP66_12850 [Sphingomonas sp.]